MAMEPEWVTRRCCFCWSELDYLVVTIPTTLGLVAPGILVIGPPFLDLSCVEGLWSDINDACGLALDEYESEEVPAEVLECVVTILVATRRQLEESGTRVIRREVAWGPLPDDPDGEWHAEIAEMETAEFADRLGDLIAFLKDASEKKKDVVFTL